MSSGGSELQSLESEDEQPNFYGSAFIGGNPKGWNEPFSENTHSGKVLRGMVRKLGIRAAYIDLWDGPDMEEKWPHVTECKFYEIYKHAEDGYQIVILGLKVKKAIIESLCWFPVPYYPMEFLPHPASRRQKDLLKLWNGLEILAKAQRKISE